MKPYTRIAAVLLTAVMALTIMTGCGGGGNSGGNGGSGGSNGNATVPVAPSTPSSETNSGTTSNPTVAPTSWSTSKTRAYRSNRGVSNTSMQIGGTLYAYNSNGSYNDTLRLTFAVSGRRMVAWFIQSNNARFAYYTDGYGNYYGYINGGWSRCISTSDTNRAKQALNLMMELYQIPSSVQNFSAGSSSDGMYTESFRGAINSVNVRYMYRYTSSGTLNTIYAVISGGRYNTVVSSYKGRPSADVFPKNF